MDKINENLLKNVNNVEQYASVTQEIMNKFKNMKVNINMTTALALTKVRPLEIEYFSKYHENGAACFLFERLLSLPPSKTWRMLKKDLIGSLKYWLQAIKKQLLSNSDLWWKFLKLILKFIEEISLKDSTIPDSLVELTADSLLEIATWEALDAQQRHKILYTLCIYCAASGREVRFALRNKFTDYFSKLACQLTSCGYFPLQFTSLETLIRWLVPRGEPSVRAMAAARWFPPARCPETAREIFLNATWSDFFNDARKFLNALNDSNGLVSSVVCRRLFVGDMLIISGAEKQLTWLDINSGVRSVSVLMDPRVLEVVGSQFRACETLVIDGGGTRLARLHSETQEVRLSVEMYQPPRLQPVGLAVGTGSDVTVVISSRADLRRLDIALSSAFGDKYLVLMNIQAGLPLSPIREIERRHNSSSEESRFSQPVEVKRRRHGEYGVVYRNFRDRFRPKSRASLSTTSTTSLAQLHDKLAALPQSRFPVEYGGICAQPQLSSVTEISETDDLHSISSRTTNIRHAPFEIGVAEPPKKKAESDSELFKQKPETNRNHSVVSDEHPTSCLLVAILGSDESVINDTVERLSKSKEYQNIDIVDLIAQEALEAETTKRDKLKDSGITSDDKKSQDNTENSEVIENTQIEDLRHLTNKIRVTNKKPSKSTTEDESNTEAILEPPLYVNLRRSRVKRPLSNLSGSESFIAQDVEGLFSQHAKSNTGGIEISLALPREINASTSNSSESFDENCLNVNYDLNLDVEQFEINDIDVIECLNDMVDKVCIDLTQYLSGKNCHVQESNKTDAFASNQTNMMIKTKTITPKNKTKPAAKQKKSIESTSNVTKKKKPKSVAIKRKNQITKKKSPKKMSTIIERNDEEIQEIGSPKLKVEKAEVTKISPATECSIVKRKRKLYSPKDDEINKDKNETKLSDSENDNTNLAALKSRYTNETPKTSATCYKEIEKERKRHIRQPRSRKSGGNFEKSPSPTSLVNDAIFDKLKSTVENKEKFILVDTKSADDVYNFSSGSEDSDFQMKRIELRKRLKGKAVVSSESSMSAKPGKQITRSNSRNAKNSRNLLCISCDEPENTKQKQKIRKKPAPKKTNIKSKVDINMEPAIELDDERMRSAPEQLLNTSIVNAKPSAKQPVNIDLVIDEPQMELIVDDQESALIPEIKGQKLVKKTQLALSLKKYKGSKATSDNDDSGTLSPLPGLIVEAVSKRNDTKDLSIVAIGRKIQQICKEGADVTNETCDTQNMVLSDNERCNSPLNFSVNTAHEIGFIEKKNLAPSVERYFSQNADNKPKVKSLKEMKDEKISQNKKKNISNEEVIEIPHTFDVRSESEKSISTDGINAHVNSDEHPPSPGALDKSIPSRDIVDMNESKQSFYVTLNRALRVSRSPSRMPCEISKDHKGLELEKSSISASPYKLSFDIRKMVPSRRTSDSCGSTSNSSIQEAPKSIQVQQRTKDNTKESQRKGTSDYPKVDSPREKLPKVSIVPLSIEDIDRWSMPKSLNVKDRSEITASSKNEADSPKFVYNTRKKFKSFKSKYIDITSDSEDECKTNAKTKEDNFTTWKDTRNLAKKTKAATKSISKSSAASANRLTKSRLRSTISPVNMNCIILQNNDSDPTTIVRKVPNKRIKPKAANIQTEILQSRVASSIEIQRSSKESSTELTLRNSSPTKVLDEPSKRPLKRKCSSPILHLGETSRNYPKMDTTESGHSVSVYDWFRRNDFSKKDNNGWAMVKDVLKNVSEKLDTSMVETNHNTSKKFVEFFVEVENQMANQQQEIFKIVKRYEEMNTEYLDRVKKIAFSLIRQDCVKKKLVVNILKEDIQAAIDHIQRLESEHS